MANKNVREIDTAVNIDTATPIKNTRANPLIIGEAANEYRITAVIILEMLLSRIDGHARANPSFNA